MQVFFSWKNLSFVEVESSGSICKYVGLIFTRDCPLRRQWTKFELWGSSAWIFNEKLQQSLQCTESPFNFVVNSIYEHLIIICCPNFRSVLQKSINILFTSRINIQIEFSNYFSAYITNWFVSFLLLYHFHSHELLIIAIKRLF